MARELCQSDWLTIFNRLPNRFYWSLCHVSRGKHCFTWNCVILLANDSETLLSPCGCEYLCVNEHLQGKAWRGIVLFVALHACSFLFYSRTTVPDMLTIHHLQ